MHEPLSKAIQGLELTEELAADIQKLAQAFCVLDRSRLKRRTILLLMADSSGLPMTKVGKVLDAAASLDKTFLKLKKKKNA